MDFLNFLTGLYREPSFELSYTQDNSVPVPPRQSMNPRASQNLASEFQQRFNAANNANSVQSFQGILSLARQNRENARREINSGHLLNNDATRPQAIDRILQANDQVLGASFLMTETATRANNINPAEVATSLHEFNQSLSDYLTSLQRMGDNGPRSVLVPTSTLVNTYSYVMRPTLALVQLMQSRLTAEHRNNPQLTNELRVVTQKIQECWRLMAHVVEANPAELRDYQFLREYALGQIDLIEMSLNAENASDSDLAYSARTHLQAAQDQVNAIVTAQHPEGNSELGFFTGIVQAYSSRNLASLPPLPSAPEAARHLITSNTLAFVSTICQEIDLMHRSEPELVNRRYTRFQMVMDALLSTHPELNLREAMNRLQNLRWNEPLYHHMQLWIRQHNQNPANAQAQINDQTVIQALENDRHPLRSQVLAQISAFNQAHPGSHQSNPNVDNIRDPLRGALTLLKGSQTLHAMLPLLARNLEGALGRMPAASEDRRLLLNIFRPQSQQENPHRVDLEYGKAEILSALIQGRTPSAEALNRFKACGRNDAYFSFIRYLISFIRDRNTDQNLLQLNLATARHLTVNAGIPNAQGINELIQAIALNQAPDNQVPAAFKNRRVPDWLSALNNESLYPEVRPPNPEEQNQAIIRDLRNAAEALERGELFSETDSARDYNRAYMNLIEFVTEAGANGGVKNQDGSHRNSDLEHIQSIRRDAGNFDDDHEVIEELLNADAANLRGNNLGEITHHWAEQVLNILDHHSSGANAWVENAIHDNENHPASYRVIWQALAGDARQAGSLAQQMASYHLPNATLANTLQGRARENAQSTHRARDFLMNFASVENLALTGVMAGSAQMANRFAQGSALVSTGRAVRLSEFLLESAQRMTQLRGAARAGIILWPALRVGASITGWASRNPVTATLAASGFAGYRMASVRDQFILQYNNAHPEDIRHFDFYEDWARNTGMIFGAASPLLYPHYYQSANSFFSRPYTWGMPARFAVVGGLSLGAGVLSSTTHPRNSRGQNMAVAGMTFVALAPAAIFQPYQLSANQRIAATLGYSAMGAVATDYFRPTHSHAENLFFGGVGTLAVLSPLALSSSDRINRGMAAWTNASNQGAEALNLGMANQGQLGVAGHLFVGASSGLASGAVASGLTALRDGRAGYDTHFWEDMQHSSTLLGIAMTTSSAAGAMMSLPRRALQAWRERAMSPEQVNAARLAQAEAEIQSILQRSARAQFGVGVRHALVGAAFATATMLAAETEMHALQAHSLTPNMSDVRATWTIDSISSTYANMLAFEGMNAGMNRFQMRNLLGRSRSTLIDHVARRLTQDIPNLKPQEIRRTQDFVWNRLAIEALRGRDLSQIAREDNIRQWQASFRQGRSQLERRAAQTNIPNADLGLAIDSLASQALVHSAEATPPDVLLYIHKTDGSVRHEAPAEAERNNYEAVQIGFSGGRVSLSAESQSNLRSILNAHNNISDPVGTVAQDLLARHGAPISLDAASSNLANIIRGIRAENLPERSSLWVTRTTNNNQRFGSARAVQEALQTEMAKPEDQRSQATLDHLSEQLSLFGRGQLVARVNLGDASHPEMYDIYRGDESVVPADATGQRPVLFEIRVPGTRNPNPSIRSGAMGLYDRWRNQPNNEVIRIYSRHASGAWEALPEAWRTRLARYEQNAQAGQPVHLAAQVEGIHIAADPLRAPIAVYHVGDTQRLNARSFIHTIEAMIPEGFEMALERRGADEWILHNYSNRDVTLQVNGTDLARNGDLRVNQGDVVKIPAGNANDGTPRFIEITLDLNHSGASSSSARTPTSTPPASTPTPPPAARRHLPVIQNNIGTASPTPTPADLATRARSLPLGPTSVGRMFEGTVARTPWHPTSQNFTLDSATNLYRYRMPADQNSVTMGRGAASEELLAGDPRVSRDHLRIERMSDASGEAYVLAPHNLVTVKRNGVVVDWPDRNQRIFLLPGDQIFVTDQVTFIFDPVPATVVPAPTPPPDLLPTVTPVVVDPATRTPTIPPPSHTPAPALATFGAGEIEPGRTPTPPTAPTPVPPAPPALADWGPTPAPMGDPTAVIGRLGSTPRACSDFMSQVPRNQGTTRYAVYEIRLNSSDGHIAEIVPVTDNVPVDATLTQGQMLFEVGGSEALMRRRANLPDGIHADSKDFLNQIFVSDTTSTEPTLHIDTAVMDQVGRALFNNDALTNLIPRPLANGRWSIASTGNPASPFQLERLASGTALPTQFAAVLEVSNNRVNIIANLAPSNDVRQIIERVVRGVFAGRTITVSAPPPPLPPGRGSGGPGGGPNFPVDPAAVGPGATNTAAPASIATHPILHLGLNNLMGEVPLSHFYPGDTELPPIEFRVVTHASGSFLQLRSRDGSGNVSFRHPLSQDTQATSVGSNWVSLGHEGASEIPLSFTDTQGARRNIRIKVNEHGTEVITETPNAIPAGALTFQIVQGEVKSLADVLGVTHPDSQLQNVTLRVSARNPEAFYLDTNDNVHRIEMTRRGRDPVTLRENTSGIHAGNTGDTIVFRVQDALDSHHYETYTLVLPRVREAAPPPPSTPPVPEAIPVSLPNNVEGQARPPELVVPEGAPATTPEPTPATTAPEVVPSSMPEEPAPSPAPGPTAEPVLETTRRNVQEMRLPTPASLSLTRGQNDNVGNLLRAQGISVPAGSFLDSIHIRREMTPDAPYAFRVENSAVRFSLVRQRGAQAGTATTHERSVFSGYRNILGEPGETVIIFSGSEAYTLTLQAPEGDRTAAPSRTWRDVARGLPGIGRFFRPAPRSEAPPPPRPAPAQVQAPAPAPVVVPPPSPRPEARRVEMPAVPAAEVPAAEVRAPSHEATPAPTPISSSIVLPAPLGEHLSAGDTRIVVSENPNRRGEHDAFFDAYGQASAFTEVGIDKSGRNTNEDAYGMGRSPDGRPFFVLVDGAGGHGSGDIASRIIVENTSRILSQENVSLAEALQRANGILCTYNQSNNTEASAVAVLARVNLDGTIEYARVGDANIWLRLRQSDGSYAVTMPFLPANVAGYFRSETMNAGRPFDTLQMIAHDQVSVVTSILGQGPVTVSENLFASRGLHYQAQLQIPGTNTPLRLQPGEGFGLICDGVAEQTNMAQATQSLAPASGAVELRQRNQAETQFRQAIYSHYVPQARSARARVQIIINQNRPEFLNHPFNNQWIDGNGNIFASANPADTTLIGHVARDNISAIWFHYDPQIVDTSIVCPAPDGDTEPSTPPPPAAPDAEEEAPTEPRHGSITQTFASMTLAAPALAPEVVPACMPEGPAPVVASPAPELAPVRSSPLPEHPIPALPQRTPLVEFPLRQVASIFETTINSTTTLASLLRSWQRTSPNAPSNHLGSLGEIAISKAGNQYTFTPPRNLIIAVHVESYVNGQLSESSELGRSDAAASVHIRPGTRVWISTFDPHTGTLGEQSVCLMNPRVN